MINEEQLHAFMKDRERFREGRQQLDSAITILLTSLRSMTSISEDDRILALMMMLRKFIEPGNETLLTAVVIQRLAQAENAQV